MSSPPNDTSALSPINDEQRLTSVQSVRKSDASGWENTSGPLQETGSSGGSEPFRKMKEDVESLRATTDMAALFLGPDLTIEYFTPHAAELLGVGAGDVGRPFATITERFGGACVLEAARTAHREAEVCEREVRRAGKAEQTERWLAVRVRPYRPDEPALDGVVLTAIDITEKHTLEQGLTEVEEQVRRKVGRDLHDTVCSDLAGMALMAEGLRRRLEEQDVPGAEIAEKIQSIAQASADRARRLSHTLVPPSLKEKDLAFALGHLCREQGALGTFTCEFEGECPDALNDRLDAAAHLYHIANEAVTNARRHAQPDHICVSLRPSAERLVLAVQDDGTGVPEELDAAEGLGLRTMHCRADMIGASLSVAPREEGGTVVRCVLPLEGGGDAPTASS